MAVAGAIKRKWRRRSGDAWRELLARHASSGLSVAAFCARESISVSSFQRWRALVAPVGVAADARTRTGQEAFVDLSKVLDLAPISQGYLNAIARQLNDRPRKCLGFETPAEVFAREIMNLQPGVALQT